MIGIGNKIKTNEIVIDNESEEVEQIINFIRIVTESCLDRDKEITKFFVEENTKVVPKWKQNL
tara:strand:- start:2394 stop:2582 length:189 start_codon:yes stop_codon:yes gene_type:complete